MTPFVRWTALSFFAFLAAIGSLAVVNLIVIGYFAGEIMPSWMGAIYLLWMAVAFTSFLWLFDRRNQRR